MAKIDKLINKINKVKSAVNSLKGISAKLQSLNYTSEIDKLGEKRAEALKKLEDRNTALQAINDKSNFVNNHLRKAPKDRAEELVYPYEDELSNYLVFDISKRNAGRDNRLADTIALYIPNELISQSQVSYTGKDISPLAKVFSEVLDEFGSPGGDVGAVAVDGAKAISSQALQKVKNFLTGGISNIKAGVVINPNKETTLNPLEFRTFSFNYEFNPQSEKEAEIVRKIIHTFRLAMLPDSSKDPFKDVENKTEAQQKFSESASEFDGFFTFPNIFNIYFDGPIGDKVDGYLPAVCTSAEVNYTGGQNFATFYDGQPVKVGLSLSFQEVRVMDRSNYEQISAYGFKDKVGKERNIASNDGQSLVERGGD